MFITFLACLVKVIKNNDESTGKLRYKARGSPLLHVSEHVRLNNYVSKMYLPP